MREEMTISLIGPLPRSHSPAWLVKSLSFITVSCQLSVVSCQPLFTTDHGPRTTDNSSSIHLLDLVAQLGGALVVLAFDRAGQFLAELGHVHLPLERHTGGAAADRHLAQVMRRALVRPL